MPKKNVRNGYYYYVLYFRENARKKGYTYQGFEDASKDADPEWKNLPREVKQYYNDMAKEHNKNDKDRGRKYNSIGVPLDQLKKEKERKQNEADVMRTNIKTFITKYPIENLKDVSFYIIHTNYYCEVSGEEDGKFIPAELAIVEFSLKHGITRRYHTIFAPSTIPGYTLSIKQHSENFHKIPYNYESGVKDYFRVYCDVLTFLQASDGKIPILYTMPDNRPLNHNLSSVSNILMELFKFSSSNSKYEDDFSKRFTIYPLGYLLFYLKNYICHGINDYFTSYAMAEHKLTNDSYSYIGPGIECDVAESPQPHRANISPCSTSIYKNSNSDKDIQYLFAEFHEQVDCSAHCSLSFVSRWAYLICSYCCPDVDILEVSMKPGRHRPPTFGEVPSFAPLTRTLPYGREGIQMSAVALPIPVEPARPAQLESYDTNSNTACDSNWPTPRMNNIIQPVSGQGYAGAAGGYAGAAGGYATAAGGYANVAGGSATKPCTFVKSDFPVLGNASGLAKGKMQPQVQGKINSDKGQEKPHRGRGRGRGVRSDINSAFKNMKI